MDENDPLAVIQNHINASIDAKLKPICSIILGAELAFFHLTDHLHRAGLLPRGQSLKDLETTIDGFPESIPQETKMFLEHICHYLRLAEQLPDPSTETVRSRLSVILGGKHKTPD